MISIPPVEVRQVRACADPRCTCVFYRWDQENGHWCDLDVTKYHKKEFGIQWRWGDPIKPCQNHITAEETVMIEKELQELIDQHNQDRRRPQQEIEDKLKELYQAQTSLSKKTGDIAWDASCLVSAKIQMLEWVLQLDWFTLEQKSREHNQQETE